MSLYPYLYAHVFPNYLVALHINSALVPSVYILIDLLGHHCWNEVIGVASLVEEYFLIHFLHIKQHQQENIWEFNSCGEKCMLAYKAGKMANGEDYYITDGQFD
jgi:hypothetical protein